MVRRRDIEEEPARLMATGYLSLVGPSRAAPKV
jgi:hypothetical protein